MGHPIPGVMVSSTFYDLREIRDVLRKFIEDDLGYTPILSEHSSFPVDPDVDTITNCKRTVEQNADILILIVGNRYGFVDSSSKKSVTNLEYLTARAKGIPIYVFIEKSVLNYWEVWKDDPEANFSKKVDNTAVFEFISQLRMETWTHGFEVGRDITDALRKQLAMQMNRHLELQRKLKTSNKILDTFRGESLRIALEKPEAWEHKLFIQLLKDELAKYEEMRREHQLGLAFDVSEDIAVDNYADWLMKQVHDISLLAESLASTVNVALKEALGPLGVEGDAEYIAFTASRIGKSYAKMLEWAQKVRAVRTDDCFKDANMELSRSIDDLLNSIESIAPQYAALLEEQLAVPPDQRTDDKGISLKPAVINLEQLEKALKAGTDCFLNKMGSN